MTKKISFEEQIKENIKKLINQNKLEESKDILNHYEKIGKYNDVELYSMKGIISMMEGNIEKAEKIFKQGLTINSQDFNLLYNIAYLYQFKENNELAIKYYKKAMRNAESEEDIKEVYKILEGLGVEEKEEEIVKGSNVIGNKGMQKLIDFKEYLEDKYVI